MPTTTLKQIEERLSELEERETKIEQDEAEILSVDQYILEEVEKTQKDSGLARSIYQFRFLISILLTVGVALVWQGVGQISATLPLVSSAAGALAVGLLILVVISWITKAK